MHIKLFFPLNSYQGLAFCCSGCDSCNGQMLTHAYFFLFLQQDLTSQGILFCCHWNQAWVVLSKISPMMHVGGREEVVSASRCTAGDTCSWFCRLRYMSLDCGRWHSSWFPVSSTVPFDAALNDFK